MARLSPCPRKFAASIANSLALAIVLREESLLIVLKIYFTMSEETNVAPTGVTQDAFSSEHAWMVQCLSLAALGLLTYLHVAPIIA